MSFFVGERRGVCSPICVNFYRGVAAAHIAPYVSNFYRGVAAAYIAPYDAKVKVLIKSAKAVIIEPSLVKYDERLFRHMSFELVHMINIYLINGQSYIESDIIGFEPV